AATGDYGYLSSKALHHDFFPRCRLNMSFATSSTKPVDFDLMGYCAGSLPNVAVPRHTEPRYCSAPSSDRAVFRRSGLRLPRDDGQIGTSVFRAGALHDVECRDRTAKTP